MVRLVVVVVVILIRAFVEFVDVLRSELIVFVDRLLIVFCVIVIIILVIRWPRIFILGWHLLKDGYTCNSAEGNELVESLELLSRRAVSNAKPSPRPLDEEK